MKTRYYLIGGFSIFFVCLFLFNYSFVYKKNIYILFPFVGEQRQAVSVDLIVQMEGRAYDEPMNAFLEDNDVALGIREFFRAIEARDVQRLSTYIDNKDSKRILRDFNMMIDHWSVMRDIRVEYVFQREPFTYVLLSFEVGEETRLVFYRFGELDGSVSYEPRGNKTILDYFLVDWVSSVSQGGHSGIVSSGSYKEHSLTYYEYWKSLFQYNSSVEYKAEGIRLKFNSFPLKQKNIRPVAVELNALFEGFLSSIESRDPEKLAKHVTRASFERLGFLFDGAQEDIQRFKESFEGAQLVSYVSAGPLYVIFVKTSDGSYIHPIFALYDGDGIRLTGVAYTRTSFQVFQQPEILEFMRSEYIEQKK
ncbi:hypothetical protein [Gilvimarinus japonicus]|uniref:hypothetical protein n=1 Tax=Gilvimarinus japonicus TaxID=1796469 RepID=UPI0036D3B689